MLLNERWKVHERPESILELLKYIFRVAWGYIIILTGGKVFRTLAQTFQVPHFNVKNRHGILVYADRIILLVVNKHGAVQKTHKIYVEWTL